MIQPAVYLHVTDIAWRALGPGAHCSDGAPWPRLQQPTVALLDLSSIHTDVWRFEGKPDYAAALIDKRVRSEGLVDGAAHIVVHHTLGFPGGFQVLFSALPLELWQQASQWAAGQRDHCALLLPAALLTRAGAAREPAAAALVSPGGWQLLVHSPSGMSLLSARAARAPTADEQPLVAAARLLSPGWAQAARGVERVELLTLGLPDALPTEPLAHALAEVTGCRIQPLPERRFAAADPSLASWRSGLPAAVPQLASRHLLGTGLARLAWQAESWVGGLTGAVALVAVGLLGAAAYAQHQTDSLHAQTQQLQSAAAAVQERASALGQVEPPPTLLQAAEFAQQLQHGLALDPLRLLADLKRSSEPQLRIQRLRLEPAADGKTKTFRVEGIAPLDSGAALMRWVQRMEQAGWSLQALDPQAPQNGAWAYALTRRPLQSGGRT